MLHLLRGCPSALRWICRRPTGQELIAMGGRLSEAGRAWRSATRALSAVSSDRVRALGPRAGRPSEPPDAGDSAVGSVQPELLAPAGIACTAHPLPSGPLKKTNDPSPSVRPAEFADQSHRSIEVKDLLELHHHPVGGAAGAFEVGGHQRLPPFVGGFGPHPGEGFLEVSGSLQVPEQGSIRPKEQGVVVPPVPSERIQHLRPYRLVVALVLLDELRLHAEHEPHSVHESPPLWVAPPALAVSGQRTLTPTR